MPLSNTTTARTGESVIGLDLLRGLAAFEVFLGHVRGSSFVEYGALPPHQRTLLVAVIFGITRVGHEAVMVFFVLSGYLVFGKVLTRSIQGQFSLTQYIVERTTRILLPLVPACLFTDLLNHAVFGLPWNLVGLIGNMVGLNGVFVNTLPNNAPLWTLAYEIWFYIIGGALGFLSASKSRCTNALVVVAVGIALFTVLDARYLLFWMLAASAIWLLNTPYRAVMATAGFSLAVCGVCLYELSSGSRSFTSIILVPPATAEFFICLGTIMVLPFLSTTKTNELLRVVARPVKVLSSISFSLYLFHYPVNACLDKWFPKARSIDGRALAFFSFRIMICLVVVAVFYTLFERNTARVRHYIQSRIIFNEARFTTVLK